MTRQPKPTLEWGGRTRTILYLYLALVLGLALTGITLGLIRSP